MPSRAATVCDYRRVRASRWAAAVWLVLLAASPASGRDLWGEILLPGSIRQARAAFSLGMPEDRPDGGWLLDYLLREHGESRVLGPTSFEQYVLAFEQARAQQVQWPSGVVLPAADAPPADRRRVEVTLQALGLVLRRRGDQYQAERDPSAGAVERVMALEAVGVDIEDVALKLNSGRAATLSLSQSRLPLPLPDYWTKHVFKQGVPPILSLTRNRSQSLLYVGLLAQDEATLAFLQQRPELVRRLGDEVGSVFASFGRSLRIRNNVVEVPGGEGAIDVWRELVGQPPNDPERFLLTLLGRDDGRLAYFYDTVAHLSPAQQRLVLGSTVDGKDRLAYVRGMARHFASTESQWKIDRLPFHRPAFDAAVALTFVEVLPDGLVGPRWLPAVLERVAAGEAWPTSAERVFGNLPDRSPDGLWMLDWLFEKPIQAQERFALLRFAQRRFGTATRDAVPDVGIALLAARDMPALPKALERMSVTDAAVYRSVAVAAYNLTQSGGADEVIPVLARWQAALGLLEQAQRRRRLSDTDIRSLLESLVTVTPTDRRDAPGAAAAWIIEQLLPALVPDGPVDDLDRRALRALTSTPAREPVRFNWEGLQYVVDAAETTFRSVIALRQTQHLQPTLTDLVKLHALRRRLERVAAVDDVGQAAMALKDLDQVFARLGTQGDAAARRVDDLREEARRLDRIRDVRDLTRVSRLVEILRDVLDLETDLTVPPVVYALAVAPTREPAAVYQEAWRAHSLHRPSTQTFGSWIRTAWQSAEVDARPGGGLMLRGALLSIDVVLADARLMRATQIRPMSRRLLLNQERDMLLRYLAYVQADTFPDDAAFEALVLGQRQAKSWNTEIPAMRELQDTLRSAKVGDWRAALLAWAAHHADLQLSDWLTPLEVLQLQPATPMPVWWHGPAPSFDGCHCLRRLDVAPDELRGRESGVLIAVLPNLPLRLAEHLRDLDLPPALLPTLLPVAIQDWIDQANQSGPADWESSAGWLRRLSRERVEEYLLALVSTGVIAPPARPVVP